MLFPKSVCRLDRDYPDLLSGAYTGRPAAIISEVKVLGATLRSVHPEELCLLLARTVLRLTGDSQLHSVFYLIRVCI